MIPWLSNGTPAFPPIDRALREPNGLLAAGGDLRPGTLLTAYRRGIFPWYSQGQPILWWSPDPRMVLYLREFRTSRSLRKRIQQRRYEIRVDSAFAQVVRACAHARRPGQHGTWITPSVEEAYLELHRLGYCHSVEAWYEGELAGGLYGLALGRVFFGESMFARSSDASKVALATLVSLLSARGFELVDCQQETPHLASLGARPIPRKEFAVELERLIHSNDPPQSFPSGPVAP
jgi:leucyl/phenylalanyl-tRNA--protein transferase